MSVNFPTAHTVTRYNAGSYVAGEWTPAGTPSTTVTVNGNIQSASKSDSEEIAAAWGTHTDGLICIRSNEELLTAEKSTAKRADRLSWQGGTYEVIRASYRGTIAALAHWKCYARLVDSNAEDGGL